MRHFKLVVVSVFYNREAMVDESVGSVIQQLDIDSCLILVDDGSTDETLSKLSRYQNERVLIVALENRGFVSAISHAINLVSSDYVAIHGAGDVSLPGRFAQQMKLMDGNLSLGVVGCYIHVSSLGRGTHKVTSFISEPHFKSILKVNPFSHGEVMFRRSVYDLVGGYRTFFKYAQDRDLWCRMSLVTEFGVVPEVLYLQYRYVTGSVSGTASKAIQQKRLSFVAIQSHRQALICGRAMEGDELSNCYDQSAASFWLLSFCIKGALRNILSNNRSQYLEYKKFVTNRNRILGGVLAAFELANVIRLKLCQRAA